MSDKLYRIGSIEGNSISSLIEIERDDDETEIEIEFPELGETWYTNDSRNLLIIEEQQINGLIERKTYELIGNNLYALSREDYVTAEGEILVSEDKRLRYTNDNEILSGLSDINISLMGGNDTCEIVGGNNNFCNGNEGSDTLTILGGQGRYLGGSGEDNIVVNFAEAGSKVNGNRDRDVITGGAAGVTFRGGSEDDVLLVSRGSVYGDLGRDTFEAVAGEGAAEIEDFSTDDDFIRITVSGGIWTSTESGLQFSVGEDVHLIIKGIFDLNEINIIS